MHQLYAIYFHFSIVLLLHEGVVGYLYNWFETEKFPDVYNVVVTLTSATPIYNNLFPISAEVHPGMVHNKSIL